LKKNKGFYIILICSILFLNGCIKKSVDISLKLKKGNLYKVEVDLKEKVSQKIKDSSLELETKSKMGYLCNVTNVDKNKNADIKVTFDSIDIKSSTPNGQTPINSQQVASQTSDKLSKVYAAFVGKSFNVKIGEYGKVKQVVGMDDVVNNVFTELNIKDEKEKEDIKKVIKSKFGEEVITKSIETITSVYPNNKVKVGENWQQKVAISDQFPIEAERKYNLKESADGTSEITVDSQIKGKEDAEPKITDNLKITYEEIKGTEKGVINLNEENGLVKNAEMEVQFSGKMKLYSDDPNLGTQTFPISYTEKTVVNVLRQ